MKFLSEETYKKKLVDISNYMRSPLWWRYERRRLALPRSLRKVTDMIFGKYELWRVSKAVTKVLSPRFARSRTLLEIDLTYVCSLKCKGCNRSLDVAPTKTNISLEEIELLIKESIERGYRWKGIRLLGGEPTLHPDFLAILDALRKYRDVHKPKMQITVVSNGYSEKTKAVLKKIPDNILIENTSKVSSEQYDFAPFNNAPIDYSEHKRSDFRNCCWITKGLGMGLTPQGYYYCAIAGGIDRIHNFNLGRKSIPEVTDDMYDQSSRLCALCGHFSIYIPKSTPDDGTSESWRRAYEDWHKRNKA